MRSLLLVALLAILVPVLPTAAWADESEPPPAAPPAAPPAPATDRGFVGFTPMAIPTLPKMIRDELKVAATKGVMVFRVAPGGPAALAGLQEGDVMLRYAGKDVPSTDGLTEGDQAAMRRFSEAFQAISADVKPGSNVEIVVERDGVHVTLQAVAVDAATMEKTGKEAAAAEAERRGHVGFALAPAALLAPQARERFGVTATTGVVALEVVPGSHAATAGLGDGDVVVEVAGRKVPSTEGIDPHVQGSGSAWQWVMLRILNEIRAGAKVSVVVEREGKPVPLEVVAVPGGEMLRLMKAAGLGTGEEPGSGGESGPKPPR